MTLTRFLLLCMTVFASAAFAQTAAPLVIDAEWLSSHLNDRNLVILHVGSKSEYAAAHIPGARYMTMDDISLPANRSIPTELVLELPAPEVLRAKLATFGISDDSRIVVTFGKDGPLQSATRVVFTLDYLGLGNQTSLLDGGIQAWVKAGKALTAETSSVTAGKLSARPVKAQVVDAALVRDIGQHTGYKLVDARTPAFYSGGDESFGKTGHIPGAINVPFTLVASEGLTFDRQHVASVFRDAGIKPGDTVVAYCHIGQQASAIVFAARLLGNPVLLYDGSFQDWVVNNRGPLEH